MKTTTLYAFIITVGYLLFQTACTSPTQHQLVGNWLGYTLQNGEVIQNNSTLIIERDGHFRQLNETGVELRKGFCVLDSDSSFIDLRPEEEDFRMRKRIVFDDINAVEIRLELIGKDTLQAEQSEYTYVYVRQGILPK